MSNSFIKNVVRQLCESDGISGSEGSIAKTISQLLKDCADIKIDNNNNVIAELGNKNSNTHIMLDAHMDQIGFMVTAIDGEIIRFTTVGGIDRRILPDTEVKILGKNTVYGVIKSSVTDKDKTPKIEDLFIDTALGEEKLKNTISIGDDILINNKVKMLLNDKVASSALDNRCGVATLIYSAYLLKAYDLNCKVSIVFSSQEETTELGAKTKAFELFPDEAIVVDVSFADQQQTTDNDNCGKLGEGTMIGFSPILDKENTRLLMELAKENNLPFQYEVMGGQTGTNSDKIAITRSGIKTVLLSIPLRYMHTATEVIDIKDIETTATLIKEYVLLKGGQRNNA